MPLSAVPAHENPFRSSRIEALPFRSPEINLPSLLTRLETSGGRGSLIGPKGSGKTTLIEALASELRDNGTPTTVLRLTTEQRRTAWRKWFRIPHGHALLIDGAEQLPGPVWWWIRLTSFRRPYLVTTSHKQPHLPLLHTHTTSPELLSHLLSELMESPPPDHDIRNLFLRHNGNLRRCFRDLYDSVSQSVPDAPE
jgi:hypothetical protein